jgi:hypothetical protein
LPLLEVARSNLSKIPVCKWFQVLIEEDKESGGGIGNLCIKSPGMFHEYWRLPQVHNKNLLKFNKPEINMQLIVVYG